LCHGQTSDEDEALTVHDRLTDIAEE
jgi:hypothetical protein